jgi:hypothetical protein
MTVWLPILMSMNRRKFFQRSAVVAALCTDGMLPSSLEAQSPTAPLSGSAEAAAVAAINPPAGVRVAGILMIPVVGGKYKVLDQAPRVRQDEGVAAAWRARGDARLFGGDGVFPARRRH